MPGKQRAILFVALAASVFGLTACGSSADKTIPPTNADAMLVDLDAAQQAASSGDCTLALAKANEFATDVNNLPSTVGADVKAPLQEAATRLKALAGDSTQCQPTSGATGQEGAQSSTTPPAEPPTESASSSTTTSTPEPPAPPENGGGNEGGGPPSGGEGNGGTGGTGTGGTGG